MTLVVAWIARGTSFVVADSVCTVRGQLAGDLEGKLTSFGEKSFVADDRQATERNVKVMRVGPRHIAAIAGRALPGVATLGNLKSVFATDECSTAVLRNAVEPGDYRILLLGPTETQTSAIRIVYGDGGDVEEEDRSHVAVVAGSVLDNAGFVHMIEHTIASLAKGNAQPLDPDRELIEAIVALQAQGPRSSQMHRGIGGAFYGMRTTDAEPVAHHDLLFVFFRRQGTDINVVRAVLTGWRHGHAFSLTFEAKQGSWAPGDLMVPENLLASFSEDDLRALLEDLFAQGVVRPRYVAWVNLDTSGALIYEQTHYVTTNLASCVVPPAGPVFGIEEPQDKHGRILKSLPSFEHLTSGERLNALWFIASEDDLRRLVESGRVK